MDAVTAQVSVDRPREEVFAYLEDVSHAPEILDHLCSDWHLTREDPVGRGAGVRFRLRTRLDRFAWADASLIEVQAPHRIVIAGRGGKYNRTLLYGELTLAASGHGTDVRFTVETDPKYPSDRAMEVASARRWRVRRALGRAGRRLRARLEDGERGAEPIGVAGGARKPASGYRLDPGAWS